MEIGSSSKNSDRGGNSGSGGSGSGLPQMHNIYSVKTVPMPLSNMNSKRVVSTRSSHQPTSKSTDLLNLSNKEHQIDHLRHFNDLQALTKIDEDSSVLIFDLTTNNQLGRNSLERANANTCPKNFNIVHISFPSTLVRRPNFDFAKLLRTTILDEGKKLQLLKLINESSVFAFYDAFSSYAACLLSTVSLIKKFKVYMGSDREYELVLLEKLTQGNFLTRKETKTTAKPNFSLTLTIPSMASPQDKNRLFVQSIKKDSIQYSPNSLVKYFSFTIPAIITKDDPILPRWLRDFTDKNNCISILQKLLHNFEILEELETDRLSLCVEANGDGDVPAKKDAHEKVYSLSRLQKQFKIRKQDISRADKDYLQVQIPTSKTLSDIFSPASVSDSISSPDSDNLSTPSGTYELSQGIRSFAKNRYSNILPYEHTRVKLQPSPISSDTISPSSFISSTSVVQHSPLIDDQALDPTKKRKSLSYFNEKLKPTQSRDGKVTPKLSGFSDYFNANYLVLPRINPDFQYIATQAPLPSTMDDFWKVVISNKVQVIVSLNSDDELNMRKWDIYWNNAFMKKFTIVIEDTIENLCHIDGCILRVFKVQKLFEKSSKRECSEEWHKVYQLQYTKWLDSCSVSMHDLLMIYQIKNLICSNTSHAIDILRESTLKDGRVLSDVIISSDMRKIPLLVHCSAGCGRTGVFITLDYLLNILNNKANNGNKIDVWGMREDLIFIIVNELRKQRISMVQNLTQYITCYESILRYFALLKGGMEKRNGKISSIK